MLFIIKKILTHFFYPLTFILAIQTIGIIFLWLKKKDRAAKILLSTGLIVNFIIVYGFFDFWIFAYERQYPPLTNIENINKSSLIVVLGGGVSPDKTLPLISRFSNSTLFRVIEGIRLYKELPDSKMVFSGGKVFNSDSEAFLMKLLALKFGIPEDKIIVEEKSFDTQDQVIEIKSIVNKNPFILVTSAFHMPRVMLLLKHQGLKAIPAPVDFMLHRKTYWNPESIFPSSRSYNFLERIIKENLAILWIKLCAS